MAEGNSGSGKNGIAQLIGVAVGVVSVVLIGNSMATSLEREIAYERESARVLIGSLKEQIRGLHEEVGTHVALDAQRWEEIAETTSSTQQRFVEVETQFSDLERRIRDLEHWQITWYATVPATDATQDQKIAILEYKVLGAEVGQRRVKEPIK